MKRPVLAVLAAFGIAACGQSAPKAPADPAAALNSIADDYLEAILDVSPFAVVYAGLGDVVKEDYAAMEDVSPAAIARLQQTEDRLQRRLLELSGASFAGADYVLYETLKEAFEAQIGVRVCKQPLWSLNHMSGWQNAFPQVAGAQPVKTPVERAMALARWRKFPGFLATDRANLEAGLAQGYSAPKRVVARVIAQLDAILAAPPEESPLLAFAAGADGDAVFAAAVKSLATDEIAPAIAAYRDFLRDAYMPKARDDLSIKSLPGGEACYEALLRQYHTAKIGAKATYDLGRATVAANTKAVIQRGEALFGESDFGAILARLKDAPSNRFSSEEELVA
ncbi:MAG: DUF885 family protein, partial [Parvularculaceae bacterium]|nr:DUF885 family protein [Parvularculaceae bacterium]